MNCTKAVKNHNTPVSIAETNIQVLPRYVRFPAQKARTESTIRRCRDREKYM